MQLVHAFAIYGSANFGIRAMNFLLILAYTHYLLPVQYGTVYLAEIIAAFMALLGNLSMDSAIQRLYFQYSGDPAELRSFLGTAIRFGIASNSGLLLLALLCGRAIEAHLTRHADVPFMPCIAIAIATAAAAQVVQYRLAIYQTQRRPKPYAVMSFCIFGLTASATVLGVIIFRQGALGMLLGKLAATAVISLIAVWSMRAWIRERFQWRFVREALSFSLPMVPHQLMAGGLIVADRFILEHYRNLEEVGIYSLAYSIGSVMFLVTQSVSQAWLPMFFELASAGAPSRQTLGRTSSGLMMFLVAIACLGLLVSAPFSKTVLDHRYHAAVQIVPLVIMGYLFHALFSILYLPIMQAKRTRFVFLVSLIAFSVNMACNFAFIPKWGMYGAAWATAIAYAAEAIGAYLFAQSFLRLPYRRRAILACLTIAGALLWFTLSDWTTRWHGLLAIPAGLSALVLLAIIGGQDLRMTIAAIWSARKPRTDATAILQ